MSEQIFLKLGGSLITDKTGTESVREKVLTRVSAEIAAALDVKPTMQLVLGHGSGSFGHVAAARHQTVHGASRPEEWAGFAEVSDAAARLNAIVRAALRNAGVPVLTLQPSASAYCSGGELRGLAIEPIRAALSAGLVPLLYGDVAFDDMLGSTIVSTEQILSWVARQLRPDWLLLAGETLGVLDGSGQVIASIAPATLDRHREALGGSRGTDVTGGMLNKVEEMLALVSAVPTIKVRVFSGLEPDALFRALVAMDQRGTVLSN